MGEIELEVGDRVTINNKSKFLYDGTIGFCANTITKIERIGENGWYTTFEKIDENIKIGEYCRTKLGEIFKVVRINEFDKNMFLDKQGAKYYKDDIVKHSKIKSEIVEIGDYVNGKRIHKIDKGPNYCYLYYGNCKTFVDYQIKTIWTKEQLKYIEYNIN